MARLVLAALMVLVLAGIVAVFVAGLYRLRQSDGADTSQGRAEGATLQNTAFFLLLVLILYVSVSGGA